MNIVLLENLGVSQDIMEKHIGKLAEMGHKFTAYEKNTDPAVQADRCRDAEVLMLANMPLDIAAIE